MEASVNVTDSEEAMGCDMTALFRRGSLRVESRAAFSRSPNRSASRACAEAAAALGAMDVRPLFIPNDLTEVSTERGSEGAGDAVRAVRDSGANRLFRSATLSISPPFDLVPC